MFFVAVSLLLEPSHAEFLICAGASEMESRLNAIWKMDHPMHKGIWEHHEDLRLGSKDGTLPWTELLFCAERPAVCATRADGTWTLQQH